MNEFLCSQCGACCRVAGEEGFMPQRSDGACLYLTEDNLFEIYDERPELCNVKTMFNKKKEEGDIDGISEIDYYIDSTKACHILIDYYRMDEKYKIDVGDYGKEK